jgi:NAD-dependent SIR2 family protein deacetylase
VDNILETNKCNFSLFSFDDCMGFIYYIECPRCAKAWEEPLPYAKKGQKIIAKCPDCGLQFEVTLA